MNALETFKNHAYNETKLECSLTNLALAYLQLIRNTGLHPDDHLDPDGGFKGWQVLLVDQVRCRIDKRPDAFDYPCWFDCLESLIEFHQSDDDEMFTNMLTRLYSWFEDMDSENLKFVDSDLSSLVQFHDGAPEEIFEKLCDASEVIHWILEMK